MKARKYDWVCRVTRANFDGTMDVFYMNHFDKTSKEIAAIADDYSKRYLVVRVYKLEIVL